LWDLSRFFISNSIKKIHIQECEAKPVIYTVFSLKLSVEAGSRQQRKVLFHPMFLNVRRNGLVKVFVIGYTVERGDRNFGGSKGGICKSFRSSLSKTGLELLFHHFVN